MWKGFELAFASTPGLQFKPRKGSRAGPIQATIPTRNLSTFESLPVFKKGQTELVLGVLGCVLGPFQANFSFSFRLVSTFGNSFGWFASTLGSGISTHHILVANLACQTTADRGKLFEFLGRSSSLAQAMKPIVKMRIETNADKEFKDIMEALSTKLAAGLKLPQLLFVKEVNEVRNKVFRSLAQ